MNSINLNGCNQIICFLVILVLTSCKTNKKSDSENELLKSKDEKISLDIPKKISNEKKYSLPVIKKNDQGEIFDEFLKVFRNDSVFRYSRINFPIRGFNSNAEVGKRENYLWTKPIWDFYTEPSFSREKDPNIISEIFLEKKVMVWRLFKENSGYDLRYYFDKNDGKWMLVSYRHSRF